MIDNEEDHSYDEFGRRYPNFWEWSDDEKVHDLSEYSENVDPNGEVFGEKKQQINHDRDIGDCLDDLLCLLGKFFYEFLKIHKN